MASIWRKSSHSGGASDATCVELAQLPDGIGAWHKSSYSGGANNSACVEAAAVCGVVGIRDSKNPDAGHLAVTGAAFARLARQIRNGSLDLP